MFKSSTLGVYISKDLVRAIMLGSIPIYEVTCIYCTAPVDCFVKGTSGV